MPIEATAIDLPPRSNTLAAQITDEFLVTVADLLGDLPAGKGVAVGAPQDSEGKARNLAQAVRDELAQREVPVHVNTHVIARDTDQRNDKGETVKSYQAAVSRTHDGKPSKRSGARKPATTATNGGKSSSSKPGK